MSGRKARQEVGAGEKCSNRGKGESAGGADVGFADAAAGRQRRRARGTAEAEAKREGDE
jgi:hypothetical protein